MSALLTIGSAAACGDSDEGATARETVNVFAAASLTDAFNRLASAFEADHPEVHVVPHFGASSALVEQIRQGAPADVFASADEVSMAKLSDAGETVAPRVFARNRLSIIVESGNPKSIRSLRDLVDDDVIVAVCAPEVPCGRYASAALTRAGVRLTPATQEENVRAVVAKVTLGEVDAGIVYTTDVRAARDQADGVAIDVADDPALEPVYPITVTASARDKPAAAAWVRFVLSTDGRRVLQQFGFHAP